LGNKLDIHQAADTGFDRQRIFARGCSFLLNPDPHLVSPAFPIGSISGQRVCWPGEVCQLCGK